MPVNTAALKTFAPAMRRQLIEAVGRKLDLLLNSQTPDTLSTYAKQIAELREQEEENREQLLERVAYTWFNRLCALRYLDARGWHPFGCKVLMPAADGETQPELLKLMRGGSLPSELKGHTDERKLHDLLDSKIVIATAGPDPQGEVYRELFLATCRYYHRVLPDLFEQLDDSTELLLPDDILTEASLAAQFRRAISDSDCQDVEILGWLYQFYVSEKKEEVMASKGSIENSDIPAITQIFTPKWIVRYLAENTITSLWLRNKPDSSIAREARRLVGSEVNSLAPEISSPEDIRILDPACGSGNMLIEAFDVLYKIYESEGYSQRDIPGHIVQKNLFGLDVCPRAAQIATLSIALKASEYNKRYLDPSRYLRPNIAIIPNKEEVSSCLRWTESIHARTADCKGIQLVLAQLAKGSGLGSLTRISHDDTSTAISPETVQSMTALSMIAGLPLEYELINIGRVAQTLRQRYHVVITNPPYVYSRNLEGDLRAKLFEQYPAAKADLFSAFIQRSTELLLPGGIIGMMTPNVWMYITSHHQLRRYLLDNFTIESLVELSSAAFSGASVQPAVFTISKERTPRPGCFISLKDAASEFDAEEMLHEAIEQRNDKLFMVDQSKFNLVPESPIAYWVSDSIRSLFSKGIRLGDRCTIKQGLATSDNSRFLRLWHEVSFSQISRTAKSLEDTKGYKHKWYPHNKGGGYKKWYGCQDFVVNWQDNGKELWEFTATLNQGSHVRLKSREYYFRESATWTGISTTEPSARYVPPGSIFDTGGPSAFKGGDLSLNSIIGFLNSSLAKELITLMNPTLNFTVRDANAMPTPKSLSNGCIDNTVDQLVALSKEDWDSCETSMDFKESLLIADSSGDTSLRNAVYCCISQRTGFIGRSIMLEHEINKVIHEMAGLPAGGSPQEPGAASVTIPELAVDRAVADYLSYCLGCIFGRYSLDQPGLILADSRDSQAAQLAAYEAAVGKPLSAVQFKPDPDGIIPVLDGEWFEDDIVARTREFLTVTFPESSVGENLRFIEESLGKDVRKYFCSEFYKDHLQTYKKRPIYWMVQSPKKGFACLIYLHRYTKDTLNQVLNNYFRPYLQKLEARLAQLGLDQLNDGLPAREHTAARKEAEKITKVLKECQSWEQDALLPLAQQRIELDLDDGVKVNYLKLQDVLAVIPGLAAKED